MRIFGKQLLLSLAILVVSITLLGLILTHAMGDYLTDQRKAALTDSARRVSRSVESVFLSIYLQGDINLDPLVTEIESLSYLLGASVVIIDAERNILFSGLATGTAIPISYIETVMEGETVVFSGSFHPTNPDPMLVAGHYICFADRVIGAVLVSISMAELEDTISNMHRVTIISLIIVAFFISIIIYIFSRAITRPLRQMYDAVKVISGGVFEKRIPVKSKDEVGQLATQFNIMAESLHNQERIRRAFISNLSHDIRTPLTSVLGFIKAIEDGTVPPEAQPYYLGIVLDETERLIKLSNDLLDMHRIQDAEIQLNKSSFNIIDVIRATILGFEQRATQKQIDINSTFAHATQMVHADEEKIRRCLYNLLDNAIKFTQDEGTITVETTVKHKKVVVSIKDNGRGMTEGEQRHAFDRFFKGDQSRNEDRLGSGLGLSIVKEFIRAHGETVTLESSLKKGSTFTFTLAGVNM